MLTPNIIDLFAQLAAHYKSQEPPEIGNANIYSACKMVRRFTLGRSARAAVDISNKQIMPSHTPIAYINGAVQKAVDRMMGKSVNNKYWAA